MLALAIVNVLVRRLFIFYKVTYFIFHGNSMLSIFPIFRPSTGCRNTDQFTLDYDYYSSNDASRKSIDDGHRHVSLIVPDKIDSDTGVAHSSMNSVGLKRSSSILDADLSQLPPAKQPHNFMTMDVIEATVQCMVAQADECLKRGCSMRTSELMILEEYGRCLLEIKEFAFNTEN